MELMTKQSEDHSRVIVHIDIDCFYAQVEMVKNPEYVTVPLGVQQKNIVVTSNYVAREFGIEKCMSVTEAQKLCPNLILVKGEDLHDYRQISYKVTTHLQKFSPQVERLGLDENYIDVTAIVKSRMDITNEQVDVVGHVFASGDVICDCGCRERLIMGSMIAQEIRKSIQDEFKLTSCAGIAHNKLLAKLTGALHKPNQQTLIFPNSAFEVLCNLKTVSDLPGIGRMTVEILQNFNVRTIQDLQNIEFEKLISSFGNEKAKLIQNLCHGIDTSVVKSSGKPQTIGLEDSCRSITVIGEVKEKLTQLLKRLIILVSEDGRIPRTIKLTVRKFDSVTKTSHREMRQCNINPSLFKVDSVIKLSEQSEHKLMANVMHLFNKIVNLNRPYHITLLGLSFTKFLERMSGKGSITNFFKNNVEVQSITNIQNKNINQCNLMDCSGNSQYDINTDGSESEYEPSPKKSKFGNLIVKRRCLSTDDCPSPSKLKVADLHLNSKDAESLERTDKMNFISDSNQNVHCPPDADVEVFKELPKELQQELWEEYKQDIDRSHRISTQIKKPKTNTLLNYFIKN